MTTRLKSFKTRVFDTELPEYYKSATLPFSDRQQVPLSSVSDYRVSNRSAGLISRRHFDENSVEFEVFETVNFNLNAEECVDRPHPTPITVSSNHH